MELYKSWRIPDIGKNAKWIVIDGNGNIVNKNPTKEELINLKKGTFIGYKRYN